MERNPEVYLWSLYTWLFWRGSEFACLVFIIISFASCGAELGLKEKMNSQELWNPHYLAKEKVFTPKYLCFLLALNVTWSASESMLFLCPFSALVFLFSGLLYPWDGKWCWCPSCFSLLLVILTVYTSVYMPCSYSTFSSLSFYQLSNSWTHLSFIKWSIGSLFISVPAVILCSFSLQILSYIPSKWS